MRQLELVDPTLLPSVTLDERKFLPESSCIYFAIDSTNTVQYIGQTTNAKVRWTSHHRYKQLQSMGGIRIAYLDISDASLLDVIEEALIEWFNPPLNNDRIPRGLHQGKIRVSTYIDKDLKKDAEALAVFEQRSLSSLMAYLLAKAVDQAKKDKQI